MTPFDWLWICWLIAFCVIEGVALWRHDYKGTLTAHVRWWFGFENRAGIAAKRAAWRLTRALLAGFMAWLTLHFLLPAGSF